MTPQEVLKILTNHERWLNQQPRLARQPDPGRLAWVHLGGRQPAGGQAVGANLSRAVLRGADLREADLFAVNLDRADLTNTNLYRTDLRGACLAAPSSKAPT